MINSHKFSIYSDLSVICTVEFLHIHTENSLFHLNLSPILMIQPLVWRKYTSTNLKYYKKGLRKEQQRLRLQMHITQWSPMTYRLQESHEILRHWRFQYFVYMLLKYKNITHVYIVIARLMQMICYICVNEIFSIDRDK